MIGQHWSDCLLTPAKVNKINMKIFFSDYPKVIQWLCVIGQTSTGSSWAHASKQQLCDTLVFWITGITFYSAVNSISKFDHVVVIGYAFMQFLFQRSYFSVAELINSFCESRVIPIWISVLKVFGMRFWWDGMWHSWTSEQLMKLI